MPFPQAEIQPKELRKSNVGKASQCIVGVIKKEKDKQNGCPHTGRQVYFDRILFETFYNGNIDNELLQCIVLSISKNIRDYQT